MSDRILRTFDDFLIAFAEAAYPNVHPHTSLQLISEFTLDDYDYFEDEASVYETQAANGALDEEGNVMQSSHNDMRDNLLVNIPTAPSMLWNERDFLNRSTNQTTPGNQSPVLNADDQNTSGTENLLRYLRLSSFESMRNGDTDMVSDEYNNPSIGNADFSPGSPLSENTLNMLEAFSTSDQSCSMEVNPISSDSDSVEGYLSTSSSSTNAESSRRKRKCIQRNRSSASSIDMQNIPSSSSGSSSESSSASPSSPSSCRTKKPKLMQGDDSDLDIISVQCSSSTHSSSRDSECNSVHNSPSTHDRSSNAETNSLPGSPTIQGRPSNEDDESELIWFSTVYSPRSSDNESVDIEFIPTLANSGTIGEDSNYAGTLPGSSNMAGGAGLQEIPIRSQPTDNIDIEDDSDDTSIEPVMQRRRVALLSILTLLNDDLI